MSTYRKLPIRHKLRLIIMACVCAALVLTGASGLVYEEVTVRKTMRNDMAVLADMFGANSTAALTFQDERGATELLEGLRAKRAIVRAFLYTPDGTPFAKYERSPFEGQSAPPTAKTEAVWFEQESLKAYRFIKLAD